MKVLLVIAFSLLIIPDGTCQKKENRLKDPWVYEAMDNGQTTVRIFVEFTLLPSGKIPDDSIKALNTFHGLEKQAVQVVIDAPDYKYGKNSKPRDKNQRFVIPILFTFDNFTRKEWSDFHKLKGKKLLENGDKDAAKKELQESITLNKKNGEAYYILSQAWADDDKNKSDKYIEQARKHGFQK